MHVVADPEWMTFDKQMTEVAGILAAGILRRREQHMREITSSRSFHVNGLDVPVEESVSVTKQPLPKEEKR